MEQVEPINQWLWFGVEFTKSIAWPLAVVIAVWWIRPLIAPLFRSLALRKVDVDAFGFKAKIDAAEQQQETKENPVIVAGAVQTSLPVARPVIMSVEQELRTNLSASWSDVQQQNVFLLRALAETRVRAGHEFVYNRIFGSQILAMKRLDQQGGASVADANAFFQHYVLQFPDVYRTYGFDGWLGFLTSNFLVEQTGDRLRTSEVGHDFLVYLTETRLTEEKPY